MACPSRERALKSPRVAFRCSGCFTGSFPMLRIFSDVCAFGSRLGHTGTWNHPAAPVPVPSYRHPLLPLRSGFQSERRQLANSSRSTAQAGQISPLWVDWPACLQTALYKPAHKALIKCRIAYKTLIKICWLATSVAKHFISVFISSAYKMLIKRLAYKFTSEVFISALINFISVL